MQLEYEIPTPFVFQIAQPWILYNGRLFQVGDESIDVEEKEEDIETQGLTEEAQASDRLFLDSSSYSLEEIETAAGLEGLFYEKNARAIEHFQEDYMRRAVNNEFISRNSLDQELRRNKVLSLLIHKILPVITNFSLDDQVNRLIMEEEGISTASQEQNFLNILATQAGNSSRRRAQSTQPAENYPREVQRDMQEQKRRLVERINSEYRQFEIAHQDAPRSDERESSILSRLSQEIERNIGRRSRSRSVEDRYSPLQDGSILTSQLFPDRNIMCYSGGIYELASAADWASYFEGHITSRFMGRLRRLPKTATPQEIYNLIRDNLQEVEKRYQSRILNKLRSAHVKINDEYYFPILFQDDDINAVELLYKKLIEKQVKLSAIDHNEFQTAQMCEISRQREQLSRIADLTNFELNGAGYEYKDGRYWAFVTTPEFALKSPHISSERRYLPFRPAKIGVSISYDSSRDKFIIGDPVVMNQYKHPFLSGYSSMQQICLGHYHSSDARNLPVEQAVLTLLTKAKENILMGYRSGSNPYKRLTSEYFSEGWMTKREMERRGLVCLNDFSN